MLARCKAGSIVKYNQYRNQLYYKRTQRYFVTKTIRKGRNHVLIR
jgi:hypothetical protein